MQTLRPLLKLGSRTGRKTEIYEERNRKKQNGTFIAENTTGSVFRIYKEILLLNGRITQLKVCKICTPKKKVYDGPIHI